MQKEIIKSEGIEIPCYSLNSVVVGSGSAALNSALCLYENGIKDLAVVTEYWGGGTSNNAGSDKQTYYKMSLSGDIPDSPEKMAQDLYKGRCMHGDIALCEAVNSVKCFFKLEDMGVPFPYDKYGTYVGYKTDNDPLGRATSAGPLTSHLMFECLAGEIKKRGIKIFGQHEVIALLNEEKSSRKKVVGVVALNKDQLESESKGLVVFNAVNVILGTGGPAGMYKTSVYPESQMGSTGMALEIGAAGHNLTESQFGLASKKFRWNLSGTYQQVIPRYLSTDKKGENEREFLNDFFPNLHQLANAIFLKGYEWPFDVEKAQNYGSSLIDILVFREITQKDRRVFLDFIQNISHDKEAKNFDFSLLSKQAAVYLKKSQALFGTPVQRLKKMNEPAYKVFKDRGIDLEKESLEIDVCAQHNNGGLKGNIWWESNIKHLFPVGEVCGTHGVRRPGGSSLNSCQVGGLRAAQFISKKYSCEPPSISDFFPKIERKISKIVGFVQSILSKPKSHDFSLSQVLEEIRNRMSLHAGIARDKEIISEEKDKAWRLYHQIKKEMAVDSPKDLTKAFKCLDICLTHAVYLEALNEYLGKGGQSRGSYIVRNPQGKKPCKELEDKWRHVLENKDSFAQRKILELSLNEKFDVKKRWVSVRPIPKNDLWFEKVWGEFRDNKIIK
ncbi:MAG: FAD-binding protein [Acidobacteriota bacterium]